LSSTSNEIVEKGLTGLTIASFESRMAREMESLIIRAGGTPRVAASMREIPLSENQEAFHFFEKLKTGYFNQVILLTGVGTRALFQILEEKYPPSHIHNAFKLTTLVARGPKSAKALIDANLKATLTVPEPNTWREIVAMLEEHKSIKNLAIAVQEYGVSNPEFLQTLRDKGAKEVVSVPVYRWALPEDIKPLTHLIEGIIKNEVQVVLITSAQQMNNVLEVSRGLGLEKRLLEAFSRVVIGSIGPIATESLRAKGIEPDFEPEHSKMGFLVKDASEKARTLYEKKTMSRVQTISSSAFVPSLSLNDSLFIKACRQEPVERTPLWIMRQAGRYLPEYRAIRSTVSFLTLCKRPDLAAEVTVSAQEVLGVDAAILFADILLISEPLGFHLEFAESGGPVISNPFRGAADLARLQEFDSVKELSYVMEAVKLIRRRLKPHVPLIGFAGAPFTLASYLIEGHGSKDYFHTRSIMEGDFSVWDELMKRIVSATTSYLNGQAAAGAQALQLFDSWVGILSPAEYKRFVLPYVQQLIKGLKPGIPVIYFGTETAPFYPFLKETGANVIGVDWHMNIDQAWGRLGNIAVQGNLDPNVLLTTPENVRQETEKVLKLVNGKPGHIFNLGHGILPSTPLENVHAMIETVKNWKI
jgi:uroporphyrinogen decarboxylase